MGLESPLRSDAPERFAFGPFRLSPRERLLTRDGLPVEIGGRSLDLLTALVEAAGRVVHKRELLERVWPDVVVEDGSLRFHMAGLRKALGDGEDGARYIATQVGVGYAFVAEVSHVADPPPPGEPSPLAGATPPPATLPARLPRLLGREADVALLAGRLGAEARLFTVVGPGGVGKTALAVEVAHRLAPEFGGAVAFVDLGAVADPYLVPSAIAEALAIPLHTGDPMEVIRARARGRRLLLVLDNCEHLVAAVSRIAEDLAAAPDLRLLATSREPLRAHGEHLHWLGALDYPATADALDLDALLAYPAVELFVSRAVAGDSAFAVDTQAARTIAEMCRRLDGMALAIEMAAGRAAAHGLTSTARLLGDRFSLAWTGRRSALPRQQTLQATLDWSYALLTDVERHALDRLSVFVGSFSFEGAMAILTDAAIPAEAAVAAFEELAAKSLVSPDRLSSGRDAYRLLEITRAYAAARLAERGADERNATCRRHARYFLMRLEAFDPIQRGIGHDVARALGNIRAALDWSFGPDGDPAIAVPLAARSSIAFLAFSLLAECRGWCERALRHLALRERATANELELQSALGLALMFLRGNDAAAEVALRRALDIAVALGDRPNELRLLGRLQIFHERIGDYAAASTWSSRALDVGGAIGEPEAVAVAASIAGITDHLSGDQQSARRRLELCLRQALPSERARTIHYGFDHRNRAAIGLARVLWLLGYPDQATALADETIATAAALDHPLTHCIALLWGLSVHGATGDLDKAAETLDAFAEVAAVNALGPYVAATPGLRGQLEIRRGGRVPEAIGWIEESLARLHAVRYELLNLTLTSALISGLSATGRHRQALDLATATIDHCNGNGELFSMPDYLRRKASILLAGGAPAAEPEALLGDALALARQQGARAWELKAGTDLARLWHAGGRTAEATALLKPIRGTFTEGFWTADLRRTDALLREMAG